MWTTSRRTLKILAALVWHGGGLVLMLKAGSLLLEAARLRPGLAWPATAVLAGLVVGSLKAWLLFGHSCRRNLDRIAALHRPYIWQFFRPRFLAMLAAMILVGATLSRLAHHNYPFLVAVAILDLSIGVALLASSRVFWQPIPRAAPAPMGAGARD